MSEKKESTPVDPTKTVKAEIKDPETKVETGKGSESKASTITTDSLVEKKESTPVDPTKTVKFRVKYPKDYEGKKHMIEGSIQELAPDVAELFEKRGIGKLVKD